MNLRALASCCFGCLFFSSGVHSQGTVQNPSVTGIGNFAGGSMYADPVVGFDFSVNRPLQIDYLGVYDDASDGLRGAHTVGLFIRQTGQLLASAGIDNQSLLENTFRWERIPSLTLQPGTVYNIASHNEAFDKIIANYAINLSFSSDITVGPGYVETLTTSLHMPTRLGGPGAVFIGPAFGSAVPEPSTVAFAFYGSWMLVALYRAKRKHCKSVSIWQTSGRAAPNQLTFKAHFVSSLRTARKPVSTLSRDGDKLPRS